MAAERSHRPRRRGPVPRASPSASRAWREPDRRRRRARGGGQVPALDRADPRRRRGERDRGAVARRAGARRPRDLDLGARHASSSRLGELATRLEPGLRLGRPRAPRAPARPAAVDLRLPAPPRPRALRVGLRGDRLAHPGAEGAVRRRVGDRQDDGRAGARRRARARPVPRRPRDDRLEVHRGDREEPRADLHRRRRLERDPVLRRGRRAVRQALRGVGLARPLRQHRGRLPAAADGGLPGRRDPRHQLPPQHRRRVRAAARLRRSTSRSPRRRTAGGSGSSCSRATAPVADDVDLDFLAERSSSSPAARSATARWPPRSARPTRAARSRCATWCARSRRSTASRVASRSRPTSSASTASCARSSDWEGLPGRSRLGFP